MKDIEDSVCRASALAGHHRHCDLFVVHYDTVERADDERCTCDWRSRYSQKREEENWMAKIVDGKERGRPGKFGLRLGELIGLQCGVTLIGPTPR